MKTLCLISGGKDSFFSAMECVANGHNIVALGNLYPMKNIQEMDSFMYQTVGHDMINLYSQALGIPIYRQQITGSSLIIDSEYKKTNGDEVEDLATLIQKVLIDFPDLEAVSSGAILSNYQRIRIENICTRFGLISLAYLWMRNQKELLNQMVDFKMHSVLVKVAAAGLNQSHLGKSIAEMAPLLHSLVRIINQESEYGVNICGEGGEYETITLDCPLFKKRIEIEICVHSDDIYAPVSFLTIKKAVLVEKQYSDDWPFLLYNKRPFRFQCPLIKMLDCCDQINFKFNFEECKETKPMVNYVYPFLSISLVNPDVQSISIENGIKSILDKIKNILEKYEMNFKDAVMIYVFVKDMNQFKALNASYKQYFGFNPSPRVTVGIRQNNNISIEVLAYKEDRANGYSKNNLHVQGISYWAPANIGQACQVMDIIIIAGSIGLIPESMDLPKSESITDQFLLESQQSLNNVISVSNAMDSDIKSNGLSCICFVTDLKWIPSAKLQLTAIENTCDVFVVTKSLPKNALIEWHFITASKKGYDALYHVKSNNSDEVKLSEYPKKKYSLLSWENDFSLGITQVTSYGFSKFVSIRCKLKSDLEINLDTIQVEQDLWESTLRFLVKHVLSNLDGYSCLNLKCFHVDSIDSGVIQCKIIEYFKKSVVIPSVSCIPVIAIDDNSIFNAVAMLFKS